ncbi:MAG: glycoside-pentoside-hexuronide (GPH):cation symporter [Oscillospiraceae bacterium]|jgi:GPH family glycoside/pentoside/hexuronide:cation symporter|nr:glycoside-pentoside-hexuronide (GPH):cation symporter [Oscillospiraceae bacterium]
MEPTASPKTSGITLKDKIGYGMGDMGGTLFLGMIGSFLQLFYAKVLQISQQKIGVLLLVLRVWDGINDPLWGTIVDRRPPGKHGKFRPYLRAFCVPLAVSGVLMFTKIPGLSPAQYLLYAYITHILYEAFYTTVNMPLGAMASVITDDGAERSVLSTFRSVGSGLGGAAASTILPFLVYTRDAGGVKVLDGGKLFAAVLIFAVLSIAIHLLAFRLTTERVPPPPAEEKHNLFETIGTLLRNRPYLALCFASMLLIGSSLYTQAVYNFLYNDYFKQPGLYSLVTVVTYAPTALLLPFLHKLVRRFGKKRLCAWGLLLSAAANTAALLARTPNPYAFMGFCFFSGLGGTFLNMQLWALITDVLDQQELLSRKREEGTCYALFFFTRKLGQTLAGSGSSFLLGAIGYDEKKLVQSPGVASRMYTSATLVPAVAYALMALAMAFWYPLTPEKEEMNRSELRRRRAQALEAEACV